MPVTRTPTLTQRLLRRIGSLPIPKLRGLYARLPAYLDNSDREFTFGFHGLAYHGNLSQFVDRDIYYFGSYSPAELWLLGHAAKILRARQPDVTFVDVGANVGQHSLFMAPRVDQVFAFEPNPEPAERFQNNIDLNGLSNVHLSRFALGAETFQVELGSGLPGNSGSRSLVWTSDKKKILRFP